MGPVVKLFRDGGGWGWGYLGVPTRGQCLRVMVNARMLMAGRQDDS